MEWSHEKTGVENLVTMSLLPTLDQAGHQGQLVDGQLQCCEAVPFWPGSSSSSSPVVHNLLLKKSLENFTSQFTGLVLFTEMYECFALLFQ